MVNLIGEPIIRACDYSITACTMQWRPLGLTVNAANVCDECV